MRRIAGGMLHAAPMPWEARSTKSSIAVFANPEARENIPAKLRYHRVEGHRKNGVLRKSAYIDSQEATAEDKACRVNICKTTSKEHEGSKGCGVC